MEERIGSWARKKVSLGEEREGGRAHDTSDTGDFVGALAGSWGSYFTASVFQGM